MVDLQRIISVVEIESVRLRDAYCRSAVAPGEVAEAIKVKTSRKTSVVNEPTEEEPLVIEAAFTLEIRSRSQDELQAEIRGAFELAYGIPKDESFSSEECEAFGEVNAVFNAWPYWREFVQSSLVRMAMPPLTMPVFRVLPEAQVNGSDEEPPAEG